MAGRWQWLKCKGVASQSTKGDPKKNSAYPISGILSSWKDLLIIKLDVLDPEAQEYLTDWLPFVTEWQQYATWAGSPTVFTD